MQSNDTLSIDEVIKLLTLDTKQLSSYTSKFTSAEDNRPSAQTLGSLGIIVLVCVFGFIIYLDSTSLFREFKKLRNNCKSVKRRISERNLKTKTLEDFEIQTDIQGASEFSGNSSYDKSLPHSKDNRDATVLSEIDSISDIDEELSYHTTSTCISE